MRRVPALATALLATLAIAGCSGSDGATTAPANPAASQPAASEPAASEPGASAAPPAAEGCAPSTATAAVSVEMVNFAFEPADTTAAVGDTVGWANSDAAPHTATLDDGSCQTGNIPAGGSGALVFNVAGTFPYHCAIHPTMTGTITITE